MVFIGLVAMYSILNAGNPNSLLRPYLPNPSHDIYVALGSSMTVFLLGFVIFYTRDREGFEQLIHLNSERIRSLRQKGEKDEAIADAILAAMGSRSGYRYQMSRKKLVAYLAEFK